MMENNFDFFNLTNETEGIFGYGDWRDNCDQSWFPSSKEEMAGKLFGPLSIEGDDIINCMFNSNTKHILSLEKENSKFHLEMSPAAIDEEKVSLHQPECNLNEALFHIEKQRELSSVALRRDVINKAIVRAVRKFFNRKFKWGGRAKNMSSKTIYSKLSAHVTALFNKSKGKTFLDDYLASSGLSTKEERNAFSKSIMDIIVWKMSSKKVNKKLSRFYNNNKDITLLEDILQSYSHVKIFQIFSSPQLKILFEFFISEHGEEFLASFEEEQQARYRTALDDFKHNFHNCIPN